MKIVARYFCFLFVLALPAIGLAAVNAGIGKVEITPPIGTPSAGYIERKGEGMEGVHDPLLAIALFIDNGEKKIVFCSVDHLGFTYDMVQEITKHIHTHPALEECEVFVGSSHTHSGGGAYLDLPVLGAILAGNYDANATRAYIDKTCDAILQAYQHQTPAKIGIGYGEATPLSQYRGLWPKDITPLNSVTVIKVVHSDGSPLAILFNYPVHPTVLKSQNRLFSADFVGYARDYLHTSIGFDVQPIYFNGAQGDIIPAIFNEEDRFDACDQLAKSLAKTVKAIWETTDTSDTCQIATQKESYSFKPQPNPFGLTLPVDLYKSEVNVITLNKLHALITMPGELSCLYDKNLKAVGKKLGFEHVSILGLTNDAHGYIILPESWQHKTVESGLSFGGENYGDTMEKRAEHLLKNQTSAMQR
ncbi:MAG: neutral/alkaline non-lysosomal ceramidase N-terminal domain-containing protein [Chlamydiales bacterium]